MPRIFHRRNNIPGIHPQNPPPESTTFDLVRALGYNLDKNIQIIAVADLDGGIMAQRLATGGIL